MRPRHIGVGGGTLRGIPQRPYLGRRNICLRVGIPPITSLVVPARPAVVYAA